MIIFDRVINAWLALVGKPSAQAAAAMDEGVALKSELARLRLDLHEAQETVQALRAKLRERESRPAQNSCDALDGVFGSLAAPLSQLRMQACLLEAGRDIPGTSVMALARQLANLIEAAGLQPMGSYGDEIPFDPEWCGPLSADSSFSSGEPVVVRFVGYRHNGRVIRKALVEGVQR